MTAGRSEMRRVDVRLCRYTAAFLRSKIPIWLQSVPHGAPPLADMYATSGATEDAAGMH